jgi:transglutaminase-like putative cysteine protease
MNYDVRQVTDYSYARPVVLAQHVLRVVPMDGPGQRVLACDIDISPKPSMRRQDTDFFGNRRIFLDFDAPHRELTIDMRARVAIAGRTRPLPGMDPPWERVRETAFASADISPNSPVHALFPSTYVPRDPLIRAYASASFPPGRPILEASYDLARRIQADFAYAPGETDTSTPAAKAFAMRRGVCQDFTHIMISGLRGLGLPAAYVSGYLRTIPPPGKPRLEGADATHAWVSVWCGPELGWWGLDPTNGLIVGEDHITLAVGRDFVDVAPNGGVVIASGDHEISVAVDVKPVAG